MQTDGLRSALNRFMKDIKTLPQHHLAGEHGRGPLSGGIPEFRDQVWLIEDACHTSGKRLRISHGEFQTCSVDDFS
jgi:hypothetical protein